MLIFCCCRCWLWFFFRFVCVYACWCGHLASMIAIIDINMIAFRLSIFVWICMIQIQFVFFFLVTVEEFSVEFWNLWAIFKWCACVCSRFFFLSPFNGELLTKWGLQRPILSVVGNWAMRFGIAFLLVQSTVQSIISSHTYAELTVECTSWILYPDEKRRRKKNKCLEMLKVEITEIPAQ